MQCKNEKSLSIRRHIQPSTGKLYPPVVSQLGYKFIYANNFASRLPSPALSIAIKGDRHVEFSKVKWGSRGPSQRSSPTWARYPFTFVFSRMENEKKTHPQICYFFRISYVCYIEAGCSGRGEERGEFQVHQVQVHLQSLRPVHLAPGAMPGTSAA